MKVLISLIFLFSLSSNCHAFTGSQLFKRSSNTADYVVVAKKISGYLGCEIYAGYPIESQEQLCADKVFGENISKYNSKKRTDEFVVLSTIHGNKLPGEVLSFDLEHSYYPPTTWGGDYLMFIFERDGQLIYYICDIFEYERVSNILAQKPSIDVLFNKLRENPNGSCGPDPTFNVAKPKRSKKKTSARAKH